MNLNFTTSRGGKISIEDKFCKIVTNLFGVPHLGSKIRIQLLSRAIRKINLSPGSAILDAGCGYGFITKYLSKTFDLTGVDSDEKRLDLARRICPNSELIKADLWSMPLDSNKFELVICLEVLEHINHDVSVLSELTRVTKHGGWLFFSFPSAQYNQIGFEASGHVRPGYNLDDFKKILGKVGLKVEDIYPYGKTFFGRLVMEFNGRLEQISVYLAAALSLFLFPLLMFDEMLPGRSGSNYFLVLKKK